MLSDADITLGTSRLVGDKLTGLDVSLLVTSFRLLLGPLKSNYPNIVTDLVALDDSVGTDKKAASMAAILLRLQAEDFGVSTIDSTLVNSDDEQRRLLLLYGFGLLYDIPVELMDQDIYSRMVVGSRKSQRVDTIVIP